MFVCFAMANLLKNPWIKGKYFTGFWTNSNNTAFFDAVAHSVRVEGTIMLRNEKKNQWKSIIACNCLIVFEILVIFFFQSLATTHLRPVCTVYTGDICRATQCSFSWAKVASNFKQVCRGDKIALNLHLIHTRDIGVATHRATILHWAMRDNWKIVSVNGPSELLIIVISAWQVLKLYQELRFLLFWKIQVYKLSKPCDRSWPGILKVYTIEARLAMQKLNLLRGSKAHVIAFSQTLIKDVKRHLENLIW